MNDDFAGLRQQNPFDEHYQGEFLDDDSVNLNCVFSWNVTRHGGLKVDLHNHFRIDTDRVKLRPERLAIARIKLRSMSAGSGNAADVDRYVSPIAEYTGSVRPI